MIDRPGLDEYFLTMARHVSLRSTCPSRKVGAVLIDPETSFVIATGYNGAPRNTPHCGPECLTRESGKDWDKCRAIHAESNVLISAAMNGARTMGGHLYLTVAPCLFCSRLIINAGIKKVIAMGDYVHSEAVDLLLYAGVQLTIVDIREN